MRVPHSHGVSVFAARSIRNERESKGLTRAELADRMNSASPPPSADRDDRNWPQWSEQQIVALEHGHKGRRPNLDIDELYAVCETLGVTLFDLVLPNPDDVAYGRISLAFFGFELTPSALAGLRWRSGLAGQLEYHPDVKAAGWEDEVDFWRNHTLGATAAEEGDATLADELSQAAIEAAVRRDGHQRLTIERLTSRVRRGEEDVPDDATIEAWGNAYFKKFMAMLNDLGGGYEQG